MIITTPCTASVPLYPDIQRVETFKLLAIVVSNDLKWNPHIAYIIHKANSRLHFLRQLKRAAVPHHDMLHFYIAVIHPVLEYAVHVWHTGLTADLSDQLETAQKRTIHIVFGGSSFTHHSYKSCYNLEILPLSARRDQLATHFFSIKWSAGKVISKMINVE